MEYIIQIKNRTAAIPFAGNEDVIEHFLGLSLLNEDMKLYPVFKRPKHLCFGMSEGLNIRFMTTRNTDDHAFFCKLIAEVDSVLKSVKK